MVFASAPIIHLAQTTSTNEDLARRWRSREAHPLAPYTAVIADFQSRGKGRLERAWVAPPRTSLLLSLLVPQPADQGPWVPLAAGLATTRVLRKVVASASLDTPGVNHVELKWPNDVLLGGSKVAGILAQRLGEDESGLTWVALGVGINLHQTQEQLPAVPATSLALHGITAPPPAALAAMLRRELAALLDPGSSQNRALPADYRDECISARQDVQVTLPDGSTVTGQGTDVNPSGALVVQGEDGQTHTITAGDVALWPAPPPEATPTPGPTSPPAQASPRPTDPPVPPVPAHLAGGPR